MATDQHYPMNLDGRVTEVKRLRAEVVRLRHTIHAYEKTEISEVNQSGTSDREVQPIMQHYASYRRESADTQVISELKSQVLALEEKLRASTRQGIFHMHSSALDSYTNFKFELESVRRNEQANVSLFPSSSFSYITPCICLVRTHFHYSGIFQKWLIRTHMFRSFHSGNLLNDLRLICLNNQISYSNCPS